MEIYGGATGKALTERGYFCRGHLGVPTVPSYYRTSGRLDSLPPVCLSPVTHTASHQFRIPGPLAEAAVAKCSTLKPFVPLPVSWNVPCSNINSNANINRNAGGSTPLIGKNAGKNKEEVVDCRTHNQLREDCQYLVERAARLANGEDPDSPEPPPPLPEPKKPGSAAAPPSPPTSETETEEPAEAPKRRKFRDNVKPVLPDKPWYIDPARIRKSR